MCSSSSACTYMMAMMTMTRKECENNAVADANADARGSDKEENSHPIIMTVMMSMLMMLIMMTKIMMMITITAGK